MSLLVHFIIGSTAWLLDAILLPLLKSLLLKKKKAIVQYMFVLGVRGSPQWRKLYKKW
jgi:hypothetical protein